jgi:hypothetical protein
VSNTFHCKVCHIDFPDRVSFLQHTRTPEHKAIKEAEEQGMKEPEVKLPETYFSGFNIAAEEAIKFGFANKLTIPINFLPPETKVLKNGTFIGVKVFGKYNKELGLTVQNVELIRK